MAVPKNPQTRLVGITYHIHYISPRLLLSNRAHMYYIWGTCMQEWKINTWINIKIIITTLYILNQKCMILIIIEKSQHSGCDTLSLHTAIPASSSVYSIIIIFYTCTNVLFMDTSNTCSYM